MPHIFIFAGTSEGRLFGEYLHECGADFTMCVATEYGREAVSPATCGDVRAGRLDVAAMKNLFSEKAEPVVIDATHPYAAEVSGNLKEACGKSVPYYRFLREKSVSGHWVYVKNAAEAAEWLKEKDGNILLTTGSKNLCFFTTINNFSARIYPRMLPDMAAIEECVQLGYRRKNIICMQGPFSKEINIAFLKEINAKFLVTKEAGAAGGFDEKVSAAKELGVEVIVIERPVEESGYSFDQLKNILIERFGIKPKVLAGGGYFPIFIPIEGRKTLVIGGGIVASRRVKTLLDFGALVTVVSEDVSEYIEKSPALVIHKPYDDGDVDISYSIVIAASDSRDVNRDVGLRATALGVPVSVADKKEESTFFFPAIVNGGGVTGGVISNGGHDHHLAKMQAEKIRGIL